jgi:hypothetical protein
MYHMYVCIHMHIEEGAARLRKKIVALAGPPRIYRAPAGGRAGGRAGALALRDDGAGVGGVGARVVDKAVEGEVAHGAEVGARVVALGQGAGAGAVRGTGGAAARATRAAHKTWTRCSAKDPQREGPSKATRGRALVGTIWDA